MPVSNVATIFVCASMGNTPCVIGKIIQKYSIVCLERDMKKCSRIESN
jgi:hypothetical protein